MILKKKYSFLRYLLFILIACGLSSCSSTKYVPDGEYLLDKIHIKSDHPDYGTLEMRSHIRQLPNYKMFGINKTQLQFYNLSGKDTSRWINRFIRRIGESPVIYDSTMIWKTTSEMERFFINKGYMDAVVTAEVDKKGKKVDVTYRIQTNQPYLIREYVEDIQDSTVYNTLYGSSKIVSGEPASLRNPLVKKGMLFDRDVLDKERDRLTGLLRNRGYYAFEKDYISYFADTNSIDHGVDLILQLHPYPEILPMGTFVEIPHHKYFFDKVYIYLDYDPLKMTGHENYIAHDSIVLNNYIIYYQGAIPSIRPSVLTNNSFLIPGRLYSQLREEATYSSYASLQALSNANIHFEEFFRNDTALLTTRIFTMPAKKQSTTFSIEGTNTAGDFGVAASTNYTHQNLFKGSEMFNFKVHGAYEAITVASSGLNSPYLELGADASIRIPKFMFPFLSRDFKRKMRASTEFSLSYNYQTRPEFVRTLLSGGFRYLWEGRGVTTSRHQFDLLDINYIYLPRVDSGFLSQLPSSAVYFGYRNQFIVGMGYSYTYSTLDPEHKNRNVQALRLSVESAGNVLYALSRPLGFKKNGGGSYLLFNTDYAQFVKGDIDYSKTIYIDKNNSIAWRIGGGIGIPYGNSEGLPFEKRYYSGGANSVRAWSVRELGPGSYQINDSTNFFYQSGDIKLDLNIEYRTRFFWKLEAAAFIDAGNIWTIRNYEGQKGGLFKFDSFYKELAVGYGLGLRLDYDFFLLRADFGWKAYNPANSDKDRWTIFHPNFTNNFAWHIAVGYPF
ncbi:membrane protein [Bacteroidia bacterium]|nr:membrane protein [Bacteroidia bacterium]